MKPCKASSRAHRQAKARGKRRVKAGSFTRRQFSHARPRMGEAVRDAEQEAGG